MLNPAVFRRIVERLLENAKEAKRDIRRHLVWHVKNREINLDVLLVRELVAKTSHRCRDTQNFELRRVQLVGEGLDIGRDLYRLLL